MSLKLVSYAWGPMTQASKESLRFMGEPLRWPWYVSTDSCSYQYYVFSEWINIWLRCSERSIKDVLLGVVG